MGQVHNTIVNGGVNTEFLKDVQVSLSVITYREISKRSLENRAQRAMPSRPQLSS